VQCSLLLLSLNDLKRIGEKFGQVESKRVLLDFTDLLKEVFRDSDIFGRVDDNEFAIFLVESDDANTKAAVVRLYKTVGAYNDHAEQAYSLQFSVGHVVTLPGTNLTLDDLLALARERMESDKLSRRHWYEDF
jgi:diguanylate cyclase (GGDEF)-like protein